MIRIENSLGVPITSVEEWGRLAPPARPEHWCAGRSAMESARAWFRSGVAAVPNELRTLLDSRPETRGCEITLVVPELGIQFDECGGNDRNADVMFSAGHVVGTIEAKADESFGKKTVGDELKAVTNPRSRLPERINLLSQAVFGRELDDAIGGLRYQLLFSFAATVVEARRQGTEIAVFVVHEFLSADLSPQKVANNATALTEFVGMFPGWTSDPFTVGELLPAITLPGGQFVPGDLPVMLGKIQYMLSEPLPG